MTTTLTVHDAVRLLPPGAVSAGPLVSRWLDAESLAACLDMVALREVAYETPHRWAHQLSAELRVRDAELDALHASMLADYRIGDDIESESSAESSGSDTSTSRTASASESGSSTVSRGTASTFPQTRRAPTGDYATSGTDSTGSGRQQGQDKSIARADSTHSGTSRQRQRGRMRSLAAAAMEAREAAYTVQLAVVSIIEAHCLDYWDAQTLTHRGRSERYGDAWSGVIW